MTDSSKDSASYMGTADAIRAGTCQFNNDPGRVPEASNLLVKDKDGFIWGKLREVAKYYLYTMSRSNLVNGLSKTESVQNVAIGVLTAGTAALYVLSEIKSRKGGK